MGHGNLKSTKMGRGEKSREKSCHTKCFDALKLYSYKTHFKFIYLEVFCTIIYPNKLSLLLHEATVMHLTTTASLIKGSWWYKIKIFIIRFKVKIIAIFYQLFSNFLLSCSWQTWQIKFIFFTRKKNNRFIKELLI